MPSTLEMNDKQVCGAGVSILDQDNEPFDALPAGYAVSFSSDNPAVADFVVGADGMNGDITSVKVGSAVLTATVTAPDGSTQTDTISVAVKNSAPGSVNFTAGTPRDE